MRSLFRNNLKLKPSILAAFAFLTVPVFFTVIIVNYISNDNIARANAAELVERFRVDALANIQADFNPLKSLVRSSASIGNQDPDFYSDNRCFRYFYSIVLHSSKIVSAYVGLQDGSFRQTRRVDPGVSIQGKLPPQGSEFAFRWVVPTSGKPLIDHYTFLDSELKELGSTEEVTTYDPRVRLWYRSAEQAGTTTISDPDIFAALGLIGFTV